MIASDHGSTRLPVISSKESPWEMPERGMHSGRCCHISDTHGFRPAAAIKDDNDKWYSLADYSRFKGAHMGSVEVHGGATLEEIVVPIIEFTWGALLPSVVLATDSQFRLKPMDTHIKLVIKSTSNLEKPVFQMNGKVYAMRKQEADFVYFVQIPMQDTLAENEGLVFEGSTQLPDSIKFTVIKGMQVNSFDDLFD